MVVVYGSRFPETYGHNLLAGKTGPAREAIRGATGHVGGATNDGPCKHQ